MITEGERIERVFPIARAKGEDIGGGVRSKKPLNPRGFLRAWRGYLGRECPNYDGTL